MRDAAARSMLDCNDISIERVRAVAAPGRRRGQSSASAAWPGEASTGGRGIRVNARQRAQVGV